MSDVALRLEHVYKKFRKGEMYDSLRDLIPALMGRGFGQRGSDQRDRREFWALQDISFEVKKGEAFGIIGANGAGKSTTLKILSRIIKPTKGRFLVEGRLSALIEVTAGFHQDLTGRENIFLYGTILGMTKREIQSKLDQIIAFSGIEEFIDTPIKRYSTGMYARLGFSVAAHINPDVLIVDEVLSVGDYLFQRKCVERMREVIRGGAAVVFVSHNFKDISGFCNRCMILDKGRAIMTGPAHEVVSAYLQRPAGPKSEESASGAVFISRVVVRNENGECGRFESGDTAWIDVEITARTGCNKVAVVLYVTHEDSEIFQTSTERLGHGSVTLEAGEVYRCTFEVRLNVVTGIYHPSIALYRYDTQTRYDHWGPAATIYVSSPDDVQGLPHFFPKVIHKEICPGPDANCASTLVEAVREGCSGFSED